MKAHLWTIILLIMIGLISIAHAEMKTYEGIGEYYMDMNKETTNEAKLKAKENAQLDAVEQAKVNIESYSEVNHFKLTKDEIISITAGILYPQEITFDILQTEIEGMMLVKAVMIAQIDTEKIPEYVTKELKQRGHKK